MKEALSVKEGKWGENKMPITSLFLRRIWEEEPFFLTFWFCEFLWGSLY